MLTLSSAVQPVTVERGKAMAMARILVSGRGSQAEWDSTPPRRRKVIVVDDPEGRKIRISLIEYE